MNAKRLGIFSVLTALAFASSAAFAANESAAPSFYNVRAYDATGDGKTLDHEAINKAIDAASAAGGGTVYVGPGTYLCGTIHMKSNINLHIDAGATILGAPQNMNAYDETEEFKSQGPVGGPRIAYQDGGHCYFQNSLIAGIELKNVSITGQGMINGGGLVSGDGLLDRMCGIGNFGKKVDPAVAATQTATEPKPARLGNKAIGLKLCKNVLIRDVTIFHGGHFAILTTGCDGLTVDNVTMDTNRDGIDIDACRNVMISNCRINSPGDDGLCPKSTFALGENRIEENMVITNCQVSGFVEGSLIDGTMKPKVNGNGRLKFGTEASGGFRNVTVSNITFRDCRGLALEEVDGGTMENITISNITMMDTWSYPIYITTGKRNRSGTVEHPSILRHILISNVVATDLQWSGGKQGNGYLSGIQITGLPDAPIEDVRLENIRLHYKGYGTAADGARTPKELAGGYPEPRATGTMPGYGVFARHVKDLELANIKLYPADEEMRPALVAINVDGLEIDNFKAKLGDGVKAARFEKVTGDVIRNSPLLEKADMIERKDVMSEATAEEKPVTPKPAE